METLCKMIDYRRTLIIDEVSEGLLRKLEQDKFPYSSVANMITKKRASLIKVFCDEKLYGILVVRGIMLHKGELCMVIDHAIACEGIAQHFGSILNESLRQFVANEKFNGRNFAFIHQHAHNKIIRRMLENFYGEPAEYIFKMDVREFKNAHLSGTSPAFSI